MTDSRPWSAARPPSTSASPSPWRPRQRKPVGARANDLWLSHRAAALGPRRLLALGLHRNATGNLGRGLTHPASLQALDRDWARPILTLAQAILATWHPMRTDLTKPPRPAQPPARHPTAWFSRLLSASSGTILLVLAPPRIMVGRPWG